MIAIIDYGLGNINALFTVYKKLNILAKIVSEPKELEKVDKIILPGVGAFDYAMDKLEKSGMLDSLNRLVLNERKQVLGICIGMQIMTLESEEGQRSGLGWLNAQVRKIQPIIDNKQISVPHMGWNNIKLIKDNCLLQDLNNESYFFFLNSYFLKTNEEKNILAMTNYGQKFVSVVNQENIYGVQFHPEKSHRAGITLLKNFSEL